MTTAPFLLGATVVGLVLVARKLHRWWFSLAVVLALLALVLFSTGLVVADPRTRAVVNAGL